MSDTGNLTVNILGSGGDSAIINTNMVESSSVTANVVTGAKGDKGDKGDVGPKGYTGDDSTVPGPPNVLAVGTVTTGAAGTNAAATITGASPVQTLNLTIPRGNTGSPTEFELRGTGSPEGVVTAAVGTYYTDTAGTLGAWRWQKRTGAGNTGWVCTSGDTGARNISASISGTYYSGGSQARLSRVNGTVFLTMDVATIAGYTTTAVLTLPTGFVGIPSYISPGSAGTTWFGTAGTSISLNFSGANAGLRGTWSWRATDAWPTSLPGTAA